MTATAEDDMRERLRNLPKAELHVHLDGSLRPETLLELAERDGRSLPTRDLSELRRYMAAPPGGSLEAYLERFEITLSVMQSADTIERITFELAEDLAQENVRYAEIRFSPILNTERGLSPEAALEASLAGKRRAEESFDIRIGLIVCGIRSMDPTTSVRLAQLAVHYSDAGVVAFDLAGAEHGYPPSDHQEAFAIVRAANLGLTIHAGEAYGPESIRQALHLCGAHRIGHGTRLGQDRDLFDYVRDFRVPLEMCLTSNVQTGASTSFEEHPLRKYFNDGVVLSLNTDNRLISGVSLTEEYWRAHTHLGLRWIDLAAVARSGFESAFLPWPDKLLLLQRFDQETARLTPQISR